jgi:hypothetical protein
MFRRCRVQNQAFRFFGIVADLDSNGKIAKCGSNLYWPEKVLKKNLI